MWAVPHGFLERAAGESLPPSVPIMPYSVGAHRALPPALEARLRDGLAPSTSAGCEAGTEHRRAAWRRRWRLRAGPYFSEGRTWLCSLSISDVSGLRLKIKFPSQVLWSVWEKPGWVTDLRKAHIFGQDCPLPTTRQGVLQPNPA